jgi:hypothetical protein
MQPFHSDRSLMNVASTAALIAAVTSALDPRGLLLAKHHYLLYAIVPAIQVIYYFKMFGNAEDTVIKIFYRTNSLL